MVGSSGVTVLAKVLVSAIILGIVLSHVEFSALRDSFSQIRLPFLFVAIAIEIPLLISGVQRWRLVAAAFGERLALGPALVYMLIALFISLGLPSVLGLDAARMWKLRQHLTSLHLAARIVITDRLCSFASLLFVIAIGLPQFSNFSNAALFTNVTIAVTLCGTVGLVLISALSYFAKIAAASPGITHFYQLSHDFNHTFFVSKSGASIFFWGVTNHLLRVAMIFGIALSLGLTLSPINAFTLVPIALLTAMIPVSIGGWGVREAAFIMAFSFVGVAPAGALALSVLFGLIGLLTALIGGIVWMTEEKLFR